MTKSEMGRAKSALVGCVIGVHVGMSNAQPVYTASAYDIANLSLVDQVSENQPVFLSGTYQSVYFESLAERGFGMVQAEFVAGQQSGVGVYAYTICDDLVISGPAGSVQARFRLRLTSEGVNRSFTGYATGRLLLSGLLDQIYQHELPPGTSDESVLYTSNPVNLPVGAALPVHLETSIGVGGDAFTTPTHFGSSAFGFEPGELALILPEGYTANSACMNIVNNVFAPAPVCIADVNGDGVLDNGDITSFVAMFLSGDLGADFTADGILDNGDIGAFVEAFLAGC